MYSDKLYKKTFPGHVKSEDLVLFNIENIVRSVPYSKLGRCLELALTTQNLCPDAKTFYVGGLHR